MTDLPVKFRPPGPLKIDKNFKLTDWEKWLNSYRWYSGAVNLSKKSPDEQLTILKGIMGPEALEIWGNFSVYETSDVESVLKKFEEHFTPKLNVPLERLNFNRLIQQPGQCFDDFLSAAISQVDKCNFGDMRDDFLRDKIVAGIDNDDLRATLLAEDDLTYHKTVQMCRESAKDHFMAILEVKDVTKVEAEEPDSMASELVVCGSPGTIKGVRPDRRRRRAKNDSDDDYEEKPFACEIAVCTFRTSHQKSLDRHMKIHKGEKRYACNVCGYKSAVLSNVRDHMKTHTGEKPFVCHHCGFKCALKGYIRNHLKVHLSDKPFACDSCDYRSNRLESLNRHKLRHTGEKPFACEVCDFRCSQKSSMKIHMRGHTGEKPYACDECEYRSIVPEKLRIHKMRCHTGEKPYACDFCDIGFADQGSLRQHRRTHTGERPYACDVCEYRCALRGNLRKHMMRHTGEKPYACHVCEYRSAQPGSLKTHLKTHTGEKPNVCDICGHRCAHKGNLKKHMLTHTGEKPYACSSCSYRSAQSSGLKTHMKTHTGEKPYVCDICGFRCAHNGNLKQHMKTHNLKTPEARDHPDLALVFVGEKPYVCDICGFRCAHNGNLKVHMKTHNLKAPEATDHPVTASQVPWTETYPTMNPSEYVGHTFAVLDNHMNGPSGVHMGLNRHEVPSTTTHAMTESTRTVSTGGHPAHDAAHSGSNSGHTLPGEHPMSNSLLPLSNPHGASTRALPDDMLQSSNTGHAHSVLQESSMQHSEHSCNSVTAPNRSNCAQIAVPDSHQSPFQHSYTPCQGSLGQPT